MKRKLRVSNTSDFIVLHIAGRRKILYKLCSAFITAFMHYSPKHACVLMKESRIKLKQFVQNSQNIEGNRSCT
jgi:hypothetical protein